MQGGHGQRPRRRGEDGRSRRRDLTAVEYAREYSEEKVYFVSRNTQDFGDGTAYPYPMNLDLDGIEHQFVHLTALDQVVKEFAKPVDVFDEQARAVLFGSESATAVSSEAYRLMALPAGGVWLAGTTPTFEASMAFLAEILGTGDFETVTTEAVHPSCKIHEVSALLLPSGCGMSVSGIGNGLLDSYWIIGG
ncbi:hypothetical protein [Streptomyces gibsoniae]|uniref:Uncharacterized protein n=1 Tax=Streptomyces gibsoniae TaxID=3075529 RepID=A0ABU2TV29_9ACTN|nr:hypothetical protein [Streptomyces sp. DSM 41699]MDT0464819.1 hypothetical protein [Streptomyces sp. DSM 41699]